VSIYQLSPTPALKNPQFQTVLDPSEVANIEEDEGMREILVETIAKFKKKRALKAKGILLSPAYHTPSKAKNELSLASILNESSTASLFDNIVERGKELVYNGRIGECN
jgi:hypothetical protein